MRLFRELIGLCTPGVSIRTICPAGRLPFLSTLTIPWMRLRVVCGFRVTIATFSPTSALSRVDFPALGRPMIETNPERNAMSGLDLLGSRQGLQADADTLDAALGGLQDFEAKTVVLEDFANGRDTAGEFTHQSTDGCGFLFVG